MTEKLYGKKNIIKVHEPKPNGSRLGTTGMQGEWYINSLNGPLPPHFQKILEKHRENGNMSSQDNQPNPSPVRFQRKPFRS